MCLNRGGEHLAEVDRRPVGRRAASAAVSQKVPDVTEPSRWYSDHVLGQAVHSTDGTYSCGTQ